MIMNDEPQSVENEPRFKLNQKVFVFDDFNNCILKGKIIRILDDDRPITYLFLENSQPYSQECDSDFFEENQIFPDFASCKVAAHATYLQKIKELLEQKEYAAN